MSGMEQEARAVIEAVKDGSITDERDLHERKKEMAQRLTMDKVPGNAAILAYAEEEELDQVRDVLGRKPTRTISGVATFAVMWMWEDFSCPYSCAYCPQGTHNGRKAPKSYTGKEPSARRAIDNAYDPYKQIRARLDQYKSTGHPADKAELIIMGGTFPSTPTEFQEQFVKRCFDALNGEDADSLREAQQINETADHRNVGLTVETRPDFVKVAHVNDFLRFGATRVEIGVQTLDDAVQEATDRGHGTEAVVQATQRLKDCGFKVCYHMMLGLPEESRESDIEKFRTLFNDPRFQPDELKIYPTAVIKGTKLYEMMENGEYEPLTEEELYERLMAIKPDIPPYVRIKRIMRDIPSTEIDDGASRTNARQLLHQKMEEKGLQCRCIRCREAGHVEQKDGTTPDEVELVERQYTASNGREHFLSIEDVDQDIILGYLRLRFPSSSSEEVGGEETGSLRPEIDDSTAIVRQVQVVGPAVPIGAATGEVQHSGYGTQLMERAEDIARENGYNKVAVISAVGTREYYRKLGYTRDGPYMSKQL